MPSYKLTYFDLRGRAEVIRLLFTMAGQEFEDVRIAEEDWPAFKAETPLGQLPVLQIDNGKMIPQSHAIMSYLAREFGFYGSTSEDALKIDVVCYSLVDFFRPLSIAVFYTTDETEKAELLKEFYDKTAPYFLKLFEKMLIHNGGGDGFLVGDKISLADLGLLSSLDQGFDDRSDVLEPFPKLVKLKNKLASEPKIAEYLAKRPKTL